MGRDDPELDVGEDLLAEVDLDGVQAQVLERAFDRTFSVSIGKPSALRAAAI